MDFREFEKRIVKVTKMELPGETVQMKMAPAERLRELKEEIIQTKNAKQAGVMVLFYPTLEQQTNLILILRKTNKEVHSAQVGFPGGKIESLDNPLQDAALGKPEEKVAFPRNDISVIKNLPKSISHQVT